MVEFDHIVHFLGLEYLHNISFDHVSVVGEIRTEACTSCWRDLSK